MPEILNTIALMMHRWCSAVCRRTRVNWVLLGLVAVAVLAAPVTQHLWTWDRFLRGGQDFETGAFLILMSLCLVAVLARSGRADVLRMFAALSAIVPSLIVGLTRELAPSVAFGGSALLSKGAKAPSIASVNLPLQI